MGKSTFINRLLGENAAITAREDGVTRDVRYFDQVWNGKSFRICDSGGVVYTKNPKNPYQSHINAVIESELTKAHTILFMVDVTEPDHPDDFEIRSHLRPYLNKTILVVTKADNADRMRESQVFFSYGFSQMFAVSAMQNTGVGDLLDAVVMNLSEQEVVPEDRIQMALIGKPNAGKSSLFNGIFNQPKAIVDHRMGTTRDVNTSIITLDNHRIEVMDTAGLRRQRNVTDTIEYFSIIRTEKAIERADIVVFLLDAQTLLTDQDKKILGHILDKNKNLIVFVNKWDLLDRNDHTRSDIIRIVTHEMPALADYPIIMGSAVDKHNIHTLLTTVIDVVTASEHRVQTSELNQFLERFFASAQPPSKKGKLFKVFYATQIGVRPPRIVVKVNDKNLLTKPFLRRFERAFREFFPHSTGVGIYFDFQSKVPRD